MEKTRKTIFFDKHLEHGARMVDFAGWQMPLQYTGIMQEHAATRQTATLFDTCHMGEFRVRGRGATADLERLISCRVGSLDNGQCRYGLLCNAGGGVIDDLLIYRFDTEDYMLVVNAGTQATDYDWITARLSPGVDFNNISHQTAKIDLQGPDSRLIMERLTNGAVTSLKYYRFQETGYRGSRILVSRTGYTGELGYEIYCGHAVALTIWDDCVKLGAVPAGLGARDTLRLECGLPLYGHELRADRNAGESGFTFAIAGDKSFTGSEVVRDTTKWRDALVGIKLEGRRAAREGDVIMGQAGLEIGVVTSGSFAPSLGYAVALGYVRRKAGAAGTGVLIQTRRETLAGAIAGLPFYKHGTARQ